MQIDVVSDIVCPWCYIGKRQLESAIAQYKIQRPNEPEPTVVFRPFQLNPTLPSEGMERSAYLMQKFGTSDGGQIYQRVNTAAEQVGLNLKLDKIARQPNTLKAHALMQAAPGVLDEAMFKAYFIDSCDLTDDAVLKSIALDAGVDGALIDKTLNDVALHQAIAEQDSHARSLGITGVPFFIFDQKNPISGAAGAGVLLEAMLGVGR
jgi:predicted DsbA family dithiol-disulfide isomerase